MKILIKDSTGDLIPVSIGDEETFRDLNERMKKEHGIRVDFTNLQYEKQMNLDQNILAYLSDNNQEAAVGVDNYLRESAVETHDLNPRLSKEKGKEPLLSLEEVAGIIPEGYHLISTDSELRGEEFCEELQGMRSEEIEMVGEMESADIKVALVSERNEVPRSEDIFKFSKVVFELNNDMPLLSICRLCATRGNEMVYMFENNEIYNNVIEKIERCLSIAVKKTDNLPKQACHSCLEKLELCHRFHKTVAEAEKQLLIFSGRIFNESKRTEKYCQAWELGSRQRGAAKLDEHQELSIIIPREIQNMYESQENNSVRSSALKFANKICGRKNVSRDGRVRNLNSEDQRISESQSQLRTSYLIKELRSEERVSEKMSKNYKSSENGREKFEKDNAVDNNLFREEKAVEDGAFCGQNVDCKLIKCRICGEVFHTAKKCHIHSSVHASENYYPCSLCDKTFTNEKDCNEHSTEHTEGKKFERRAATHVCKECGKKFVTEARLQFHKIYHNSDTKPCYCKKCDKVMASESSLYQHMLTVHRQYKEYCCDICGKQFRAQAQLGAHQRKHKDERPFECTICKKRFYSNDILRRHKKLHLPDKPYQCDQCGKRFDRNNTLTKHLLRHQVEAGRSMMCHVCSICKEVFVNAGTALIHLENCMTNVTDGNNETKILELNLKEMYRCEYCEKCYTEIEFMKNHRSCHSEPSPYICTVCDTTYATYNQATAHKTAHKKSCKIATSKDESIIPKYFACEYCDKRFLHFTNMNIHRRSCSNGKIWTCRYCGAIFENARELSRHKKGETNEETWLCNDCNNSFGSECALEIHRETHSVSLMEKKKFSCLHCEKIFTQKAHLTIHVRSHTGERPYSCDLCEKAYKIKTERDNHRRTHSGDKPFKCSICEKTFANTARLREHMRFHSGKRPYNCSLCNQSFKKANARNVHMTIHTGEKPYQCDICGTNFRRTGDMRKHKRTQHGQKLSAMKNETGFEMDCKIVNPLQTIN